MTRAELINNSNEFREIIKHRFDSVLFNKMVNKQISRYVWRNFKMGKPLQTRKLSQLKNIYKNFLKDENNTIITKEKLV